MSHFADEVPSNAQELSLLTCECSEGCEALALIIRNPMIEPNAEKPEELLCKVRIPIFIIPGLVAALMAHYAEHTHTPERL